MSDAEFSIGCEIRTDTARRVRYALGAFLDVLELDRDVVDDILMAVGEALANSVEHAYAQASAGRVEVRARAAGHRLLEVTVADCGAFVERAPRPGRGFGLDIIRAVARSVDVERDGGTRVHMTFDIAS